MATPIDPIKAVKQVLPETNVQKKTGPDFKSILESTIKKVNSTTKNAEQAAADFATGKTSDIHSVIIAAEKADIMLQLTTEVRNKIVESYREIMRMQI